MKENSSTNESNKQEVCTPTHFFSWKGISSSKKIDPKCIIHCWCKTMRNKQEVTVTKESISKLMEVVRNLYLSDDIPWVIGYSGGKDSTATLQLVWLALSELFFRN